MIINQHAHETTTVWAPRLGHPAVHRGHWWVADGCAASRGLAPFPQSLDTRRCVRNRTVAGYADRAASHKRVQAHWVHDPVRRCCGVSGRDRVSRRALVRVKATVAQVPVPRVIADQSGNLSGPRWAAERDDVRSREHLVSLSIVALLGRLWIGASWPLGWHELPRR